MIQERIARYQSSGTSELRFNLLAVCRNKRQHCQKQLAQVLVGSARLCLGVHLTLPGSSALLRLALPGSSAHHLRQQQLLRPDSSAPILAQIGVDLQLINAALLSHGQDVEREDEEADDDLGLEGSMDLEGKTVAQLRECVASCKSQRYELRQALADEEEKAGRYAKENARRRHNFIPLIMQLLQGLAKRGKLEPLVASATERAKARAEAAKAKGQS